MQHFVTDDGERVFYRVSGSGPPLVLLHEWGSSHRIWEPLAGLLQASFTVYRWDARGHGGHPARGSEAPSVSRMAKDLAAFLDHLRMDKPIVVGASMGALTLWEYVRRHGCHRLSGICVVDQSPRLRTDATWSLGIYGDWPPDRDAAFVGGLETDFVDTVLRLIAFGNNRQARESYEADGPGTRRLRAYLATLDPKPLIAIWRSLTEADYRAVLPTITVPALSRVRLREQLLRRRNGAIRAAVHTRGRAPHLRGRGPLAPRLPAEALRRRPPALRRPRSRSPRRILGNGGGLSPAEGVETVGNPMEKKVTPIRKREGDAGAAPSLKVCKRSR